MKNFLTIEGCEGVGKTYHTKRLQEYCQDNGINVLFTREPGGSKVAERIRSLILDADNAEMTDMCEAFLYAASRVQHLEEVIIPALNQGKIVFCDRYVDSSYAYQGFARGLGLDTIKDLNRLAVNEYFPQYTLFLDLSPQKAFERKGGADKTDRLECQNIEFHEKVYEGYKNLAQQDKDRYIVIDATGSKDETFEKIVSELKARHVI